MKSYGLPYQGSKNKIAEWIVEQLPSANTLVDLFAGGCAITHCAMLSGKYQHFIANDLRPTVQLFRDAISGKYANYYEWISREQFKSRKYDDMLVALLWSFGNDASTYLYSRENELLKECGWHLVTSDDYNTRRKWWRLFARRLYEILTSANSIDDRLSDLQSLQSLERLQSLEQYQLDYTKVPIPDNSVIYCDIPYRNTKSYNNSFDYDRFYDWAYQQTNPVYISEYTLPDERFTCVASIDKRALQCGGKGGVVPECLFVPNTQLQQPRNAEPVQLTLF